MLGARGGGRTGLALVHFPGHERSRRPVTAIVLYILAVLDVPYERRSKESWEVVILH